MSANRDLLDAATKVATLLDYDPITGLFLWRAKEATFPGATRWNSIHAGVEAGSVTVNGYRRICFMFNGKRQNFILHRLAWFMVHGRLPAGQIDHINRRRNDNRILNLRDVDATENNRNRSLRHDSSSGATGVTWNTRLQKWQASVNTNGRRHHLGVFLSIAEASAVALAFRLSHGFSVGHGMEQQHG